MYKIRNTSLDNVLQDNKIKDLFELSEDKLYEICEELKVTPAPKLDEKRRPIGNNRIDTIEKILKSFSVSFFMGRPYWNSRHIEIAKEREMERRLESCTVGEETFALFSDMGWGVNKLKPGQTVELDLTESFVKSDPGFKVLLNNKRIEVTNLENNEVIVNDPKDKYSGLDYFDLKKKAEKINEGLSEDKKIKIQVKKEDLIKSLIENETANN